MGKRIVRLTSSLRTIHTPESQKRFTQTQHGGVERVSRFLKLDPNGYCNTLRAGTASDPVHSRRPDRFTRTRRDVSQFAKLLVCTLTQIGSGST